MANKKKASPPRVVPDAPMPEPAKDVADLARTPVTLGVVLALGGLIASGLGATVWQLLDLKSMLTSFQHDTQKDLKSIQDKLDAMDATRSSPPTSPSVR